MILRRITVINFTRMGDILQSGPLLRSLKVAHPASKITLVVFDAFRDAAQRLPMVDSVIGFSVDDLVAKLDGRRGDLGAGIRELRRMVEHEELKNADLVVNLSHTPLSSTLAFMLKPQRVWGGYRAANSNLTVNGEAFHYLYSIMEDRRWNPFNLVEIYQRIHPGSMAVPHLELALTNEDYAAAQELLKECGIGDEIPYCVIQAGASGAARRWPTRSFAELADGLSAAGYASVLVGSRDEQPLAQEIASRSQKGICSLTGRTTIEVLGAILAGAHRLVSNDTGTIHLAAAVGTQSVGLFLGPASAKDTAPYGNGHWIIEPDLACAPCSYQKSCADFRCHRAVTVDQILALTLAGDDDSAARAMTGVRIYRTQVHADGAFELRPMNDFSTGNDWGRLRDYRRFWDALWGQDTNQTFSRQGDEPGIDEMIRIYQFADEAVKALIAAGKNPAGSPAQLARQVQVQSDWQKLLRTFVEHYPNQSPLPNYLLTRLNRVHTEDLAAYIADLSEIIRLFEKGLRLLKPISSKTTEAREIHAATA